MNKWGFGAFAGLLLAPALAHADNVLVIGEIGLDAVSDPAPADAAKYLQDAGDTVTLVSTVGTLLPADLTPFQVIYMVSIAPLQDSDLARVVDWTKAGGHLFATGERYDHTFTNLHTKIHDLVLVPLLNDSAGIALTPTNTDVDGGSADDPMSLGGDEGEFSTRPEPLATMYLGDPGYVAGVPDANVFAHDQNGGAAGVLWKKPEVKGGLGCMVLLMDVNFWTYGAAGGPIDPIATTATQAAAIEHLRAFLHDCDDLSDGGVGPLPTPDAGGSSSSSGAASSSSGGSGTAPADAGTGGAAAQGVDDADSGCGCRTAEAPAQSGLLAGFGALCTVWLGRRVSRRGAKRRTKALRP